MSGFDRSEGRRLFGADPDGYDRARLDYPARVFAILAERCGLRPGAAVLEVGPGTGKATRRVLDLGADPLVAVEPDPALAAHLRRTLAGRPLDVVEAPIEDAGLPAARFDVGIAASSFHWVDEHAGLAAVARALRPGGWWAMWWTIYGDPLADDPFRRATDELFRDVEAGPARPARRPPFGLDAERHRAALEAAGFEDVEHEVIRWRARLDAARLRALYATFSPLSRLEPARRERLLDGVERIAREEFGGAVERPLATPISTARRPPS